MSVFILQAYQTNEYIEYNKIVIWRNMPRRNIYVLKFSCGKYFREEIS